MNSSQVSQFVESVCTFEVALIVQMRSVMFADGANNSNPFMFGRSAHDVVEGWVVSTSPNVYVYG